MDYVFEKVMDIKLRPIFDEAFEGGYDLHKFGLGTNIAYFKYRKVLLVSSRDMVLLIKIKKTTNACYLVGKSIVLDDHPPLRGIIRADLFIGGWKIVATGPNSCTLAHCAELDFKLPAMIVKQVAPKSGNVPYYMRNYLI